MTDVKQPAQRSSSESSEKYLSVDDVTKAGPLNVIGQLSSDVNGCKIRVNFVNSHWLASIRLLFVGFVYVVNKWFVRCQ